MTDNNILKEYSISTWAINNKMTVFVLMFIIIIGGLIGYKSMPREAFPEVVVPQIFISTIYPGNAAVDVEKLVTQPLEQEINTISGVEKLTSTSMQGYSIIMAEFDFSVSPEEALRKVKDKVDATMSDANFPKDLPANPSVMELNISEMMPIMNINLSGNFSQDQLKDYAEILQDKIENLSEITAVDIRGVQDKEVAVTVDLYKMQSSQISFSDIESAIKYENMTVSGGELLENNLKRNVRVIGEFDDPSLIGDIIVKQENGNIVYLRDIAEVNFTGEERTSYAREFSKPVVMLDVKKKSGKNLIEASQKINKIIEEAKTNQLPKNLEISITNDMSTMTQKQVSNLENSIIMGMILVVLILLFFLGLRNALFVGIAIPLSMLMSFAILNMMGVTLNMMVLFGLILALGMLVDNGIVVVENIYRLHSEGYSLKEASKYGVGEVAVPIIASTATTLAAFIPLALWPGIMGQFMKHLPITLIVVLGSSLFVGLVVNPMLTSVYMKLKEDIWGKGKFYSWVIAQSVLGLLIITIGQLALFQVFTLLGIALLVVGIIVFIINLFISVKINSNYIKIAVFLGLFLIFLSLIPNVKLYNAVGLLLITSAVLLIINKYFFTPGTNYFQSKIIPWMESKYERSLRWTLKDKNPVLVFFGTVGLLLLSFVLMGIFPPKTLFFPETPPKQVYVFVEYPEGTDIEKTNDLTIKLEKDIENHLTKFVDNGKNFLVNSVIGQVGEGTADPNQDMGSGLTPHKARITVDFVDFEFRRGIDSQKVLDEIREIAKKYSGVKITVDRPKDGPPNGAPINIEVSGDDYDVLMAEAKSIRDYIKASGVTGYEELKLDVEQDKPELLIHIDRQKARHLNLSTGQIGDAIRTSIYGKEVSTYKDGEDDYPINIRLDDKYRYNKDALMNQLITFRNQSNGQIVQIPISTVASFENANTFSAVKRKNMSRLITISSNVLSNYNATEVNNNIKALMQNYTLPEGVKVTFTGEQEEQAKQMEFLSKALLIAVMLIFLIIVWQFNAISTPFIIMTSVLLSMIGVLIGLIIFRMEFVILMTMIGIISLAGVVVNNAIVLLDYSNLTLRRKLNEHGYDEDVKVGSLEILKESIIESGKTRLRPVLLTAITTVLGLIPLAIGLNFDFMKLYTEFNPDFYMGGDNSAFWGPMSWTVIFGLTFATFLTLIVVPIMYFLLKRRELNKQFKK